MSLVLHISELRERDLDNVDHDAIAHRLREDVVSTTLLSEVVLSN